MLIITNEFKAEKWNTTNFNQINPRVPSRVVIACRRPDKEIEMLRSKNQLTLALPGGEAPP